MQLGKRTTLEDFFLKQSKNIPRIGRRDGNYKILKNGVDELKYYSKIQPFNSKFILDLLSDEFFTDGGIKFVTWNDFDEALESDPEFYRKLASIAREKEVNELRSLMYDTKNDEDNEVSVVGYPYDLGNTANNQIFQKFIPMESNKQFKYNNRENEVFQYRNNDVKK